MNSFWQILIFLPTVGAIIGYVCKWCAIKMLFAPAQFRGIGPIGWQGVVPKRAGKFANGVADTVEETGVTVDAMLAKISDADVLTELDKLVDKEGAATIKAAANALRPGALDALPASVLAQLQMQIAQATRRVAAVVVADARTQLPLLIDVRAAVVEKLSGPNANRLTRLFQTVGARELKVVIYYGAVLGFIIGLLEVGFYAALERWWLLPIVGAIDGLVNNWLAIQMIFRPLVKKRYLGVFPFQGLFPARQDEISRDYAAMLSNEVLTIRTFLTRVPDEQQHAMIQRFGAIIERELEPTVKMMEPMLGAMLGVPIDEDAKAKMRSAVVTHVLSIAPAHLPALEGFINSKLAVAQTLETTLAAMPKDRFERVLRGIFEEDEWILVALGGVLGGAIGLLQGLLILALQ
jgi:uncharacterized membrane protein YheB (UPF0754 family)